MSEQRKFPFFTDDHDRFRESVREFVQRELTPNAEQWENQGIVPRDLFLKCAEHDLLGLYVAEKWGGADLDYWFTAILFEELVASESSGTNLAIMVQTDISTPALDILGTDEQKQEFLAPAVKGEKIASLGISEAHAGSDVFGIKTTALKAGDDYLINGSKTFITNGSNADFVVLLARTDLDKGHHGGFSLILFPTGVEGFSVGRSLKKLGHKASDTTELFFDNCRIPRRYCLGQEGMGFPYLMQHFQRERLAAALSATAFADYWYQKSLKYGHERQAFGKKLIEFQVWQHQFADLATQIEASRQLVYHATDLFNRGLACTREVSMAKMFCGETASHVIDRCLQFHGGWGYMDEYKISRAFRDVRLFTVGAGTSEVMREIIAKLEGYQQR